MDLSRKISQIELLILGSFYAAFACASPYMYIPEHKEYLIDDAKGRRILADVPHIALDQVWFITGSEFSDPENPKCLTGRDVVMFSKPERSSDGVWRGKKAFLTQKPEKPCSKDMDTSPGAFDIDTATYTDPANQHPEEAWDGNVPGIFQIYDGITDAELLKLKDVIAEVHSCLKDDKCPYPITYGWKWHTKHYDLTPAIKVAQLLTLSIQDDYRTHKPCYSMVFAQDNPWSLAVGMSICYRNEAVSKVELDDEILE